MAEQRTSQGTDSVTERAVRSRFLIDEAKVALRVKSATPQELLKLAKDLKNVGHFDLAARVLALARTTKISDDRLRCLLAQQHALCTYKNPDAPLVDRLEEALAILEQEIDLRTTTDQESLGIAGAIFKRRWQADGDKEHLETSFDFYRRGFAEGPANDFGYTGINAAYVLDLLAEIEARQAARTGAAPANATARLDQAAGIRRAIIAAVGTLPNIDANWWAIATVAEAYFGLRKFPEAATWLGKARAIPGVSDWEIDSTSQQLAALARLQSKVHVARHTRAPADTDALTGDEALTNQAAWNVLQEFLDVPASVMHSAALGQVGLALSGGGFRASLFHIGVLAALAEHDLLRHVEVLSCVSGGSIIGAHYYLEVRTLLQSKADADITRGDYVDVVARIEHEFLAGVRRNIRMRMFGNLIDNWRMFFSRNYSRTHKVGELYEREIYSRIREELAPAGSGPPRPSTAASAPPAPERFINELQIKPLGARPTFHPRYDNWRRTSKVPTLVINTSSLNSGHQWQFTTSFMGEPPSMINSKVDGNYRLRRMYYDQAPDPYKKVRLGHAVGASSCVPGLFEPLQFHELFPRMAVTLVDGGVHDNQGTLSLLEQGCDNLIISDASGQMGEVDVPGTAPLPVLYRSDTVFQARMRDLQYRDLTSRIRGGVVTATFMHLKQGLEITAKDWIGCDDPKENPAATTTAVQFTKYDVRKDVQRLLSDIRTDLDSFCDAEAHALMTSGYKMTAHNLKEGGLGRMRTPSPWAFLYIDDAMKSGNARLMNILSHAGGLGFKVWGLLWPLRIVSRLALAVAFAGAVVLAWRTQHDPIPFVTSGGIISSALVIALTAVLGPTIGRILNAPGWLRRAALGLGVGLFGWFVVFVHLQWFDRWYLSYGARSRFQTSGADSVKPG